MLINYGGGLAGGVQCNSSHSHLKDKSKKNLKCSSLGTEKL